MDTLTKHILIIEDDQFIRELYEDYLKEHGFNILTAEDGESGLQKAQSEKVDLILLDIMLPKLNGMQVLNKIKEEGSPAANIPVYMITNVGQEDIIKEALKAGAAGYILKAQEQPHQILKEIISFFESQSK